MQPCRTAARGEDGESRRCLTCFLGKARARRRALETKGVRDVVGEGGGGGDKDRQLQGRQSERHVNGEWRLRLTRRLAGAFLFFFPSCVAHSLSVPCSCCCVFSPSFPNTHTHTRSFFFSLHVFCGWLNSLKFLLLAERLSKDYNSCLALQDSRFYPRHRAARRRGSHIELPQEAAEVFTVRAFFV